MPEAIRLLVRFVRMTTTRKEKVWNNGYLLAKTRLPVPETEGLLRRFKRMTTMRKKQVRKKMSLKREKLAYLYLRRQDR